MKTLAIADLHGFLPDIPPCDLLLIAGDVCPDFHTMSRARYGESYAHTANHGEYKQANWLKYEFSEWLEGIPAKHIVGIAGNHDFALEEFPGLGHALPWTYLRDSSVEIEGIRIYGIPWVPSLPRWAFSLPDDRLRMAFEAIERPVDVILSHGPPFGHLDFVAPQFGSCHVGAEAANEAIRRTVPWTFICGHIHEGRGHKVHPAGTSIYNVAHVDEAYKGFRGPVEIPELS